MVQYAASGDQLHPIIKVKCSQYATFMIDSNGRPYSWGKGYIGMGDKVTKVNMPQVIEMNT
jgi:alpha-tubulin suppressor-like RCC1 family protein